MRQNSRRVEVGSTDPNFDDIGNIYDLIRSQSEMRMNRRRVIPEAEMINANIKTADLHRKAEKLPEPKSDDLSQCYEDLLKTVQCKGIVFTSKSKFRFLTKIWIFDQNFDFDRNDNFWPKFRFLTKITIVDQHFEF